MIAGPRHRPVRGADDEDRAVDAGGRRNHRGEAVGTRRIVEMGVSPGRGRVLDCRRRTSRQLGPDCCRVRRPLREPFGSDLVERRGEGRFPVLIVAEGRHGDQRLRRFRADSLAMLDALRERAQRPLHGRDRQTNLLEIVDRQHPWLRGVAQVGEILDVAGDTLQRQIRLRLPRSDSVDLDTPIARRREEVDGPGDAPALPVESSLSAAGGSSAIQQDQGDSGSIIPAARSATLPSAIRSPEPIQSHSISAV